MNLESLIDMKNFCNVIRKAGLETEVFPMAGIRVRAIKCEHYSIRFAPNLRAFSASERVSTQASSIILVFLNITKG